ncbi:outer membrane vitamin B12 receptor btuB [Vibrio ishigakensis]|uniref:Vitamin B12 transporter BtuB n=2 Tax=Vibrio ishigakensis TaxID=1481914 RepID=A0A0B8PD35_9VIBR|nr:outer membrane vitamin B12 receptor btuB [Vibrio ishigakensis]
MKKTVLATALVSLYAPSLFAQEADSTKVDETIVVTANRFEQTQSSALASVSVVEREQIEQIQADSAYDVLKTLPGVEVRGQGTKASNNSVFIRGANSNQTLVMLDGVRLNTAAGGTVNTLGLIPAFAIERIEVIRGPRAAVYGADAIGGVISIITKPQSDSVHELTLNGGSNSSHQEGWRSAGELSDTAKGHFLVSNEGSKGYNITDQDIDQDFGYESQFASGGVTKQINDNWSAGFNGIWQRYNNQYVGDFGPAGTPKRQDTENYIISGDVAYQIEAFRSSLQVNFSAEEQSDGNDQTNAPRSFIDSKRTSVLWVNTYTGVDALTLNGGVDYSYDEANNSGVIFGTPVQDFTETTRNNTGVFATAAVDLKPVLLEASVRHDENSAYGGNTTWGVGAGWYITDSLQLTGNYGTAFRAPTFFDLFYSDAFGGSGNADLEAETSKSFEIGLNGYYDIVTWQLVAYQSDIENLIVADPMTFVPENVDEARIQGIELSLDFETGPIQHTLVGDWKDPQDRSNDRQLDRRAKQNYKWIAGYKYEDLGLSVATNYTGERPEAKGTVELDSYITVDIAASYQATDNLEVKFKVDNLFDEEYETSYDSFNQFYWVGPERSFYAGVDYRF